ncbi:MAG: hypothetical protein WA125_11135 [Desulfosporosinus sp.]
MRDMSLQFHDSMIDIYVRAKKECKYNVARFIQVVTEKGGVVAARTVTLQSFNDIRITRVASIGKHKHFFEGQKIINTNL